MKNRFRKKASALVTTLFVVVVLSTIVLAFMASMSLERQIAKSSSTHLRSNLVAQSGVDQAVQVLKPLLMQYPYHAIGYTNITTNISQAGSGNQTVTILTGQTAYTNTGAATTHYLLSGNTTTIIPNTLTANNSVALNFTNSSNPSGWIGSPVSANGTLSYRECRAPWIYQLQDTSKPHQPSRSLANYNPYISRFAFWIEDESSKIDLSICGNANAVSAGYLRPTIATNAADIDLGALPLVSGNAIATNAAAINSKLISFRNSATNVLGSSPLHIRTIAQSVDFGTNAANAARFYTTPASYANDLSGTGQKRINLNALVTEGLTASDITGDMQDIIYAITGNQVTSMGNGTSRLLASLPSTNSPFPNFGNRLFAASTPSAAQKEIYLKKIAANIRDYIDSDSQPTFISSSGIVDSGTRPMDCWPSGQWPQAIGKEAVPYYHEHAWAGYEKTWSATGTTRTADLEIDQYLEFVNPSTKDYTAPAGSFIKLTDMPTWSAGTFPKLELLDFELDVSGVVFPAGKAIVITTNPTAANDPPGLLSNAAAVIRKTPNATDPVVSNYTATRAFNAVKSNEVIGTDRGFQRDAGSPIRGSTTSDYGTRIILANTNGIVSGLPAAGFSSSSVNQWNFKGQNVGNRSRFVYASGMRGNITPPNTLESESRTGDPMSLSEQLSFQVFASANAENTRFYGSIQGDSTIPGTSTFQKFYNSYVNPVNWPDYTPTFTETASTAYAIITDLPMKSVGELGAIYDPGFRKQDAALPIEGARGGGRTLKIGQPDDVIGSAARFSATWQNAAWRLMDVFGVSSNRTQVELEPTSRGKININSVGRDGGMALKSLLRNYVFPASPASDTGTAGRVLQPNEINDIVSSISSYLTSNGPFMERGELSQISFFSANSTNLKTIGGSQAVRLSADRSREQVFRGLAEMITTRSASFAVYSVGEALQESDTGAIKAIGRSYMGSVYTINPNLPSALRSTPTDFTVKKLYDIP